MIDYDYDLFVIGAGSGGVKTAPMAAAEGIKVAIAEQSVPGGTCVNLAACRKNFTFTLPSTVPVFCKRPVSAGRVKCRFLTGQPCATTKVKPSASSTASMPRC